LLALPFGPVAFAPPIASSVQHQSWHVQPRSCVFVGDRYCGHLLRDGFPTLA